MTKPDISQLMANAAKAEASMNYPRCSTCKWWGDPDSDSDGMRPCLLTIVHDDKPDHPESKALPWGDGVDMLATTHDFGCVQHEPFDEREDAT